MNQLHPQMRAILDRRAALALPSFAAGAPTDARETFRASQAALPKDRGATVAATADFAVAGPHGAVPARRYSPIGEPRGTIVYIHGGGWVFGTLDGFDPICRELCAATRCEVISADYRLAPEHRFPVPLDDCYAVLQAAAAPERPLIVIGDSAGGNLAAACALRARDHDGPAITLQVLCYPVLDPSGDQESWRRYGTGEYLISAADLAWFWDCYAPGAERSDPLAAPLLARDFRGLPETILVLAGCDPLHDEGAAYAAALSCAGVAVTMIDRADMCHGYFTLIDLIDAANDTANDVARRIVKHLGA